MDAGDSAHATSRRRSIWIDENTASYLRLRIKTFYNADYFDRIVLPLLDIPAAWQLLRRRLRLWRAVAAAGRTRRSEQAWYGHGPVTGERRPPASDRRTFWNTVSKTTSSSSLGSAWPDKEEPGC